MILAADSVLLVLMGASYYQAIAELDPQDLDLIHGWDIWPVLLASTLWFGYVIAGFCQGIGVAGCVVVWARRYWERNEWDGMIGADDDGEGGGGAEQGSHAGGEAAFNSERAAVAVHDHERGHDETQPLLGNRA